jgi:hypothetical protein
MGTEAQRYQDELHDPQPCAIDDPRLFKSLETAAPGGAERLPREALGPTLTAAEAGERQREIIAFHARWGADAEERFAAHCQALFAQYNTRYFGGRLLPAHVRVGDGNRTQSEVGYRYYGRYLRARGRGARTGAGASIELDYSLTVRPRKLQLVLLHEMLHHYEHACHRDADFACPELDRPIDDPPYLGAALELAFLLTGDRDVRRWIANELVLPCGPDDDARIRFYLRGHSHSFVVAAYNLARVQRRTNRWYYV